MKEVDKLTLEDKAQYMHAMLWTIRAISSRENVSLNDFHLIAYFASVGVLVHTSSDSFIKQTSKEFDKALNQALIECKGETWK